MPDDQVDWVSPISFLWGLAIFFGAVAAIGFVGFFLGDGNYTIALVSWRLLCAAWMAAVLAVLLSIRQRVKAE